MSYNRNTFDLQGWQCNCGYMSPRIEASHQQTFIVLVDRGGGGANTAKWLM